MLCNKSNDAIGDWLVRENGSEKDETRWLIGCKAVYTKQGGSDKTHG